MKPFGRLGLSKPSLSKVVAVQVDVVSADVALTVVADVAPVVLAVALADQVDVVSAAVALVGVRADVSQAVSQAVNVVQANVVALPAE